MIQLIRFDGEVTVHSSVDVDKDVEVEINVDADIDKVDDIHTNRTV